MRNDVYFSMLMEVLATVKRGYYLSPTASEVYKLSVFPLVRKRKAVNKFIWHDLDLAKSL